MSNKSNAVHTNYNVIPKTLDNHIFYGLTLNKEQKEFRDSIWSEDKLIIICNSKAGTGKTLIATATADLLCKYNRYKGIVYIASPVQEHRQGFLPGSLDEKSSYYFDPFYDALYKIGVNPNVSLSSDINNLKNGTAYIECVTHTFLRGTNFENKVIIIDESQNYYNDELMKVLTRIHDNCKVILIGHTGQCDLYKNPERSGFNAYLNHYKKLNDPRVSICTLVENCRGWISSSADSLEIAYE